MKTTRRMALSIRRLVAETLWLTAGCSVLLAATQASAQSEGFKLIAPTPGGIDPHPYITSITESNGYLIKWFGFEGPYQVQRSTNLNGGTWSNVGSSTFGNSATVPKSAGHNFHRISGTSPSYQGGAICAECHDQSHSDWSQTAHARAFDTLKKIGQQNNPECVVCHTVGATVPTGFVSEAITPQFINVQCENCHGPAGDHVSSGDPPTRFPIKTKSAMLCGGCHNGFHHPTYDEWTSSPHSAVVESLAVEFSQTNRTAAIGRMSGCGACHSGAVRLEMLEAYTEKTGNNRTNVNWPSGVEAATTPTTCVVCHETHTTRKYTNVLTGLAYTNQLRNPLSSTNFFSYNTGTNFASQYNANVSICGQCHNARGASVTGTSRAPHHSPQYNIMLGNIGITANGTPPQGAHKNNALQCAGCHTHGHGETSPTPEDPTYTGHAFRATVQACAVCHTSPTGPTSATNLLFTTQSEISAMMSTTKNLLDLWATTKNTNSWAATYEKLGWEFSTPGDLSNPTHSAAIVGPKSSNPNEQAQIPQNIKDARFNLYLVAYDSSKGIHNAPYARHLLQVAQDKVNVELAR